MKKFLLYVLFFCISFEMNAQKEQIHERKILKIIENKKVVFYDSSNTDGKTMFYTMSQDFGDLVMNKAYFYDSMGRERFSIGCHSNVGFSIYEMEYDKNHIYYYNYPALSEDSIDLESSYYQEIDSYEKLINHPYVKKALEKKHRFLSIIYELNENGSVANEYSIEENGDTTRINRHEYDKNGNEIYFHYGDLKDSNWVWDIYTVYDSLNHEIYNYRIENNVKTEEYHFKYNDQGKIIYNDYYYDGVFHNKTEYQYDSKGRRTKEIFFESDELKPLVISKYKYNKDGTLKCEIELDLREPKKQQKQFLIIFILTIKFHLSNLSFSAKINTFTEAILPIK